MQQIIGQWKIVFEVAVVYGVLKIATWLWQYISQKRLVSHGKGPPVRLAVAIPAHNEGASIKATVRSVLQAGIGAEDIYILCNGCSDDTAEQVAKCGVVPVIMPVKGKEETLKHAVHEMKLFRDYTHVCFFHADT